MRRTVFLLFLSCLSLQTVCRAQDTLIVDSDEVMALKAREARLLGLDTLPQFREFTEHLRLSLLRLDSQQASRDGTPRTDCLRIRRLFIRVSPSASSQALSLAREKMEAARDRILDGASWEDASRSGLVLEHDVVLDPLDMTIEESSVLDGLQQGEVSPVIVSPLGCHLLQLLERGVRAKAQVQERDADAAILAPEVETLRSQGRILRDEKVLSHVRLGVADQDEVLVTLEGVPHSVREFRDFSRGFPLSLERQVERFEMALMVRRSLTDRLSRGEYSDLLEKEQEAWLSHQLTLRMVVEPVLADSAGLERYFGYHRKEYDYPVPAYRGAVVMAKDKRQLKAIRKYLSPFPAEDWQEALETLLAGRKGEVSYRCGLFWIGDDAYVDREVFRGPKPPRSSDYPHVLVLGHEVRGPERLQQIRQKVLEDYLAFMNRQWVERLARRRD